MPNQNIVPDNFIFTETAQRLLERLALVKIQPVSILLQDNSQSISPQQLITLYPQAVISTNSATNTKYDLILDNCSLLSAQDIKLQLFLMKKLLNPNGMVIFCTLGLATLTNYQPYLAKNLNLLDLHNLGDLMLNLHFADPVMEMETLQLTYKKLSTLNADLHNAKLISQNIEITTNALIETNLEIIYGHAWHKFGVQNQFTDHNNHTFISIDSIEYMD
jgi:hypothetical protein